MLEGLLHAIEHLHLRPAEYRALLDAERSDAPAPATASLPTSRAAAPLPVGPAADVAMEVAAATASDGTQRAVDVRPAGLEDLLELRLAVRDRLAATPPDSPHRHVVPWIWRPASTGRPLTDSGAELGMELRLSRYATPQY